MDFGGAPMETSQGSMLSIWGAPMLQQLLTAFLIRFQQTLDSKFWWSKFINVSFSFISNIGELILWTQIIKYSSKFIEKGVGGLEQFWITRHMGDFLNWLSSMQLWHMVALNQNPQLEPLRIKHGHVSYMFICMWLHVNVCKCVCVSYTYMYIYIYDHLCIHICEACVGFSSPNHLCWHGPTNIWEPPCQAMRNTKEWPRNAALTDRFSRRGR